MSDYQEFPKTNYLDSHGGYGMCHHWRQRVKVGRSSVTCSSLPDRKSLLPHPDFGIYLSYLWREKLSPVWTSGAYLKRVTPLRKYPALVVDWRDLGGLDPDLLTELVEICVSKMRQRKWIDIGCHAGHGRSGALLACLISRKEHLTGERAIAEVRSRYCRLAIETKSQEESVKKYVEKLERR